MKGKFSATGMSRQARQAAKLCGLGTVCSFDIVSSVRINDAQDDAGIARVVIMRAYSPGGRKTVEITAGDLYAVETIYQDAPLARIRARG
jgi:hypothetical protein